MDVLLFISVLFLAYINGANDNFKGVATLFASGVSSYRLALAWAAITTLAGSLLALLLASRLVETFQGKGLVPDAVTTEPAFLVAVSMGAALAVTLATVVGMPVATTHALTGGLIGAGWLAADGDVHLATLGTVFVIPLLSSPLAALALTYLLFFSVRRLRRESKLLDGLHYLSAGAVGCARGINATPKIVAVLLAGEAFNPQLAIAVTALAMCVGGVLSARKVAETLSTKIARMDGAEGFLANAVTAALVVIASQWGLPVATTHVAVGALCGIGILNGTASARPIVHILLAWVTTLPLGMVLAAGLYLAFRT